MGRRVGRRVGEWMREGGGVDEEGGGILCGVGR